MSDVARAMVAPGKGILAADESTGTIAKRFQQIQVESSEATRRAYRTLLCTAPGIEQHISGVIMYDETLRQTDDKGTPLPQVLAQRGILPGIKVDAGAKPLAGFPGEVVTEGLDKLRERLADYRRLGARFAKWRAVLTIGAGIPSATCIDANAHALARYAALCQEAGIVPIVEPEVLMDGDHAVDRCEEVTSWTLGSVFEALREHRVVLEGIVLKPSMVVAGADAAERADMREVALRTVRVLRRHVPAAVPGAAFLSGGQTPQEATEHLDAMNRLGPHPWALTFSYGRALQEPVLQAWRGRPENVPAAQAALLHRARLNGAAAQARYQSGMEALVH